MLITPAFAQTAAGASGSSPMALIVQFAPWVLIFGVFWFLMIRPQQQQQKQHKARLAALKRGDKVVTGGGIVGIVKKAAEGSDTIEVEIAANVVVTITRSSITSVTEDKPAA